MTRRLGLLGSGLHLRVLVRYEVFMDLLDFIGDLLRISVPLLHH